MSIFAMNADKVGNVRFGSLAAPFYDSSSLAAFQIKADIDDTRSVFQKEEKEPENVSTNQI
jgi:hypothetical protein